MPVRVKVRHLSLADGIGWPLRGDVRAPNVQVIGYSLLGLFTPEVLALGIIGLVPTLLALMAGIYLRGRMDAARFRSVILVLLVLSVLHLLYRSFIA